MLNSKFYLQEKTDTWYDRESRVKPALPQHMTRAPLMQTTGPHLHIGGGSFSRRSTGNCGQTCLLGLTKSHWEFLKKALALETSIKCHGGQEYFASSLLLPLLLLGLSPWLQTLCSALLNWPQRRHIEIGFFIYVSARMAGSSSLEYEDVNDTSLHLLCTDYL